MRNYYLLLCILFIFGTAHAQKYSKAKTSYCIVKGTITTTSSYCGGARPSEEMIEELQKPKPANRKTIYIKYGSKNSSSTKVIRKIVTNELGQFEVKLKKGFVYQFVDDWKSKPFKVPKNTEFVIWDIACFKKRYATPDFVLDLKKNKTGFVEVNYHQPCFYNPYCGNYSGPLPP
jgi:hypothetical protein